MSDFRYINSSTSDIMESLRRDQERQSELEHERRIALIRFQSHAFQWTGTEQELIETITRWYAAGWLLADSLEAALQRASYHFLRPDGSAVLISHSERAKVQPRSETTREAVISKLLAERGWSIFDWANEAGVAHATAIDYFRGKTKPYRSTRLKLAKALGIPVDKMPV